MSVRVMSWVLDHSRSRGIDRLVLLAVADAADDNGTNAWPSAATIARKAGVDARTAQRSVSRLVGSGELVLTRRGGGRAQPNVYRVAIELRHSAAESTPETTAESRQVRRGDVVDDPGNYGAGAETTAESPENYGTAPPDPSLPVQDPSKDLDLRSRSRAQLADSPEFAAFWDRYPRRTGKGAARQAWRRAVPRRADARVVLAAAERFAADPNRDPDYTPHPATWLNQDRWDDDPLPARNGQTRASPNGPTARADEWAALGRQLDEAKGSS